ncbi:hypothetical protein C8Q76DRAFT_855800 [Earliella scabrosa]|nr:hypothetical protein C8Q76DRAFT_855800 [Earliella scabrosa]
MALCTSSTSQSNISRCADAIPENSSLSAPRQPRLFSSAQTETPSHADHHVLQPPNPDNHSTSTLPPTRASSRHCRPSSRPVPATLYNVPSVRNRRDPPVTESVHNRAALVHPYHRINKKKADSTRHRRIWSHPLEKLIFAPDELLDMRTPYRRTIYTATLEAHIDELHDQLLRRELFPVTAEQLHAYSGLNSTTTKTMLSGLQYDAVQLRVEIIELQRAIDDNVDKSDELSPVVKQELHA